MSRFGRGERERREALKKWVGVVVNRKKYWKIQSADVARYQQITAMGLQQYLGSSVSISLEKSLSVDP